MAETVVMRERLGTQDVLELGGPVVMVVRGLFSPMVLLTPPPS